MGRNSSGIRGSYESRALGDAVENDNSVVKRGTKTDNALKEYQEALATGKYDTRHCYFSPNEKGAYVLCDKLHNIENNESFENEFQAARYLADKGYIVELGSEKEEKIRISKTGELSKKKVEGKISFELLSYEQKTPEKNSNLTGKQIVRSALNHARKKWANVAVIYDKHDVLTHEDVYAGITDFLEHSKHKLKALVVVGHKGKIFIPEYREYEKYKQRK